MAAKTKKQQYNIAKVLHWIAFVFILFNLFSGWRIENFELDVKEVLMMIHSTVGMIILVLMLVRWWWRRKNNLYTPPRWWKRPAMVGQWVLYPLTLLQVGIGMTQAAFVDYQVIAFGLIPFSSIAEADETLRNFFLLLHGIVAWILILLIAIHGVERGRFAFIDDVKRINPADR